MKLVIRIIITILLLILLLCSIYYSYTLYVFYVIMNNDNTHLGYLNSIVQIGYNLCYFIIAITVVIIANNQINKTREATSIQSLTDFANTLKSDKFLNKRKNLSELILENSNNRTNPLEANNLINYFENNCILTSKDIVVEKDLVELAQIKNIMEAVAYEFELLGHYYKKKIYKRNDIYELFSYELQRYWIVFEKLGFIDFLNDRKRGGETGYYDKFKKMYYATLRHEIILEIPFYKFWKYFFLKKLINEKENEKYKQIGIFVIEENNII